MCVCIINPTARVGFDRSSIFSAEFNRFEFKVFPLLSELLYESKKSLVCPSILPIGRGRTVGFISFPEVSPL